MEVDCISSCQHADQQATQFQIQTSVQHLCNHTCHVQHEFGNCYRCQSSGLLHICDSNCTSRVYRDPYSSICLISRKIHAPLPSHAQQADVNNARRKRAAATCSQDGADVSKRMNAVNGAFGGSQNCVSMEA